VVDIKIYISFAIPRLWQELGYCFSYKCFPPLFVAVGRILYTLFTNLEEAIKHIEEIFIERSELNICKSIPPVD